MQFALRFVFSLAILLKLSSVVMAEPERAGLDATAQYLIKPPAGSLVNLFRVIETSSGFMMTYAQSKGSVPPFTLYAVRFDKTGKQLGAPRKFDGPGTVGDGADLAPLGTGRSVAVWSAADGDKSDIRIGAFENATGKVSNIKPLGKSDDHIHDITRLSNGNLAIVTPQVTVLPNRYKNSLKIVSPSFATVADWKSIHGNGFPLDAWAYIDQTIVPMTTGGIIFYRDHVTGDYMGRVFTNSGGLGKSVKLNTTAMGTFAVTDIAYLEIKGARLSDGRIAACWQHLVTPGLDRYDVRCRLLSKTGSPIGSDFLASSSASGLQTSPEVLALDKGRFVVTWAQTDAATVAAINYRSFAANGSPLFAEKPLVTMTSADFTMLPIPTELIRLTDGSLVTVFGPSAFVPGIRAGRVLDPTK